MTCLVMLILSVLLSVPAAAQDHREVVARVKSALMAGGADLAGPCGAFQITKRVAWTLRSEGWGLLGGKSPAQNGCRERGDKFAVDFLLKADGHGVDILADAGGRNTPTWREEDADPRFYRQAFDPAEPQPDDLAPLRADIALLKALLAELVAQVTLEAQTREARDTDLGQQLHALAERTVTVEQHVERIPADHAAIRQLIGELQARPIPAGCVVSVGGLFRLSCRLTP